MTSLLDRYANQIAGTLSCYDRVVITGTIPGLSYAQGMESYLRGHDIRLIDYPRFAEPLRDQVRATIEGIAQQAGLTVDFIRSARGFRKESRIQELLRERPVREGIIHIFSAMESCPSFEYAFAKGTGRNYLRGREAKCLHYYIYFQDPEFGLCYLRVPTWMPFRLQFYCNGHNWLANRLRQEGIAFRQIDNAFVNIADSARGPGIGRRLLR